MLTPMIFFNPSTIKIIEMSVEKDSSVYLGNVRLVRLVKQFLGGLAVFLKNAAAGFYFAGSSAFIEKKSLKWAIYS